MKSKITYILLYLLLLVSCTSDNQIIEPPLEDNPNNNTLEGEKPSETPENMSFVATLNEGIRTHLSSGGYVKEKLPDFTQYIGTSYYKEVSTPEEFINALYNAKTHYDNVWDEETKTYKQIPKKDYTNENYLATVKVIEIKNDLNLGYYKLSDEIKKIGIVSDYAANLSNLSNSLVMSDMVLENGISQIKIENTTDLLIYSKTGAKLTHCGFKLNSDHNVIIRNLEFDELWQWEDSSSLSTNNIGDYDWFGWSYFKISFCGNIWIDHCKFGKSYDGLIDYSNPVYDANKSVSMRAPFNANGENGLHISWCEFSSGNEVENGYIYKMMNEIEKDYQSGNSKYLYYKALRDSGISFKDILYGISLPQKKGFLLGDSGNNEEDYEYNLKLQVSFGYCFFKNLEDRIPKLRGGNVYFYNSIVDSLEYFEYRQNLRKYNADSIVKNVNNTWKCALVSQGILCGNGGSIKLKNCTFAGISNVLKNNDSNSSDKINGGYCIENCTYQASKNVKPTTSFNNSSPLILSEDNFKWNTKNNEEPFEILDIALIKLDDHLYNENYGVGTNEKFLEDFIKNDY